jgi:hypothetical protein
VLSNEATVLSVASGRTTATLSPPVPMETIITGPASAFQFVPPGELAGFTGDTDARVESVPSSPLSRQAAIPANRSTERLKPAARSIMRSNLSSTSPSVESTYSLLRHHTYLSAGPNGCKVHA